MPTIDPPQTYNVGEAIQQAVAALDFPTIQQQYWNQNEFVVIEGLIPQEILQTTLSAQANQLRAELNRNYLPGHKKGGSVSSYIIRNKAPEFLDLYESPVFLDFLSRLVKQPLFLCPDTDPHACALYYYTEPGDHIGFHYDTSYYKGARYTILLGLIDEAPSCQLVCHLYKDDPSRDTQELRLVTKPGDCVIFNGDKLWHAVTPLGNQEYRVVLTLEYVTNCEMGPFKRIYSNLKDAFGYFGIKALLKSPHQLKKS